MRPAITRTTFGLLVTCLASTATAQTPDLATLSLEDLSKMQVQTASLHSESVVKAPGIVTVITSDEIRKAGYRTLAEALNHVPGFYLSSDHM